MTSPDLKPKQLAVAQTALNQTAEEIVELVVDVEDRNNVIGLDALEMAWADIIVSMADGEAEIRAIVETSSRHVLEHALSALTAVH